MPAAKTLPQTNFAHLEQHDPQLLRLGMLAERYFSEDPNTTLLKLRQLAELLAQLVASRTGLANTPEENQYDLLRRLQGEGVLPRDVAQLFCEIRRTGNAANDSLIGDHRSALAALKICWQLGLWFHRTFRYAGFNSGPFVPPAAQQTEDTELHDELAALAHELTEYRQTHAQTAERLKSLQAELAAAKDEQAFWSQMASEVEQEKVALARRPNRKTSAPNWRRPRAARPHRWYWTRPQSSAASNRSSPGWTVSKPVSPLRAARPIA